MTDPPASPDVDRPLLVLKGLEGNPPAGQLTPLQQALEPYVPLIIDAWWVVWCAVLVFMVAQEVRAYRRAKAARPTE